jgi:hypothetical protein
MGHLRQSRLDQRTEARSLRLQERDQWILEALGKCRFLTTKQLARLFFGGSHSATNKRLRQLLDAGLVGVWIRRLDAPNIYSLTPRGAKAIPSEFRHLPRGLEQVDHVLLINNIRIEFSLSLNRVDAELLTWQSDWELRLPRTHFIPDASVSIQFVNRRTPATLLIEADNATRSQRAFLQKLLRYASGHRSDPHFCGVLVVAQSEKWAERYRTLPAQINSAIPVWFTTLARLQEDFAGTIWQRSGEMRKYSLRSAACLPYGKDGLVYAND